ncbi:hypothetical protein F3J12_02730 [Burkholderia sp. Ax-1735]|nr:hypothetical protein [Burkholderia sp. Ap-955]NIF08495.1 hypothetical protein [Burkholderia sp. Ax-1735]NIG01294.1 hypothetical protein [Burkholderia sp. Tr-849]
MHGEPSITARSEPVWVIGMQAQNRIADFTCSSCEIRYVVVRRAYAAAYRCGNIENSARISMQRRS